MSKRLNHLNIYSVYDLKTANPKYIRAHCGVNIERTIAELNGERCMSLETQPQNKKEIFSTRSFGNRIDNLAELQQSVSQYATTAAIKLRKQNSLVKTVLVFIETSRFDDNSYRNSTVVKLRCPSNDTRVIIDAAKCAVNKIYQPHYPYAKAGVGLIELIDQNPTQLNFFNHYQSSKSQQLMKVVDQLNRHQQQVFYASSGIDPFWRMQRNMKSPAYTTRLDEIPIVRVGASERAGV